MILARRSRQRGTALVEFALVASLLLLLAAGAGDFGRIFTEAIAVKAGSATGALYGSQRNARSGDIAGIQSVTEGDASDAGAITATATQYCVCPDGSGISTWTVISCSNFLATTCSGYGSPRAYVSVNATKEFSTVIKMPGIPSGTTIAQTSWMRVR